MKRFLTLALLTIFCAGGALPHIESAIFARPFRSASAQTSSAADSRAHASKKGSITGRLLSESGQGLAGASIYATVAGGGNARAYGDSTDDEGRFRLSGLAPGAYSINVYAQGFVEERDEGRPEFYRAGDSVTIRMIKGGVITGTVLNTAGDPLIAAPVRAIKIRDAEGRPHHARGGWTRDRRTDDRGIYRIYELESGTYIVMAGGGQQSSYPGTPYDRDAPTYYPSATRDTAAEVSVRAGDETSGIDIRYRGEQGHAVSGTLSGALDLKSSFGISVTLYRGNSNSSEATCYVPPNASPRAFAIYGVADGEYEVMARGGQSGASSPRRISVKGADVTGVDLALAPPGQINGRVLLEALSKESRGECKNPRDSLLQETVVAGLRYDKQDAPLSHLEPRVYAAIDQQGSFSLAGLGSGSYYVRPLVPAGDWYVRSISTASPQAPVSRKSVAVAVPAPAPQGFFSLKTSERIEGVAITLAEGSGAMRGRVVEKEGTRLPAGVKMFVIPADAEYADDLLRYAESTIGADGSFAFSSLAPGRYLLVADSLPVELSPEGEPYPIVWNTATRKALRRAAEKTGQTVEIKPCQRMSDYSFEYTRR